MFSWIRKVISPEAEVPTLVHVTHAKAGSTWIYNILTGLFGTKVAPRGPLVAAATGGDLKKHYFEPNRIYPAMFMSREEFMAHSELVDAKRFVVIRDLRDTLVSLYFSLKVSHPLDSPEKRQEREMLQSLSTEDGFLTLIDKHCVRLATLQSSWANQGEIVLRYEDLLQNDLALFEEVLIQKLGMPVSKAKLARVLQKVGFETVFKRKLGEEDVTSHGRKGAPGDWKNHFTPKIRNRFMERYGDLLIATGYEKDGSWINS